MKTSPTRVGSWNSCGDRPSACATVSAHSVMLGFTSPPPCATARTSRWPRPAPRMVRPQLGLPQCPYFWRYRLTLQVPEAQCGVELLITMEDVHRPGRGVLIVDAIAVALDVFVTC